MGTRAFSPTAVSPNVPQRSRSLIDNRYSDGSRTYAGEVRGHRTNCEVGGNFSLAGAQVDSFLGSAELSVGNVGAHMSTCFSDERDHLSLGASYAALQASLSQTFGDERNNLSLTAGTAIGVGGGFDYSRQANPDGTNTYHLELGAAALERFSAGVTVTTLTPAEHQARERAWEASGLGDPANVGP